jgi:hypothetical protein
MKSSLTYILIGSIMGLMMVVLSFNVYTGILINNNATVGSDVTEFQNSLISSQNNFNAIGENMSNDKTAFERIGSTTEGLLNIIAVGWDGITYLLQMPENFKTLLTSVEGNVGWIDDSVYAAVSVCIVIFIFFSIIKAKKTTSEIA